MKKLFVALLFCVTGLVWAQFPANVSPDVNWLTIESNHFDIIFDERIKDDANEIANKLDSVYDQISHTMGGEIDRYTIILPAESTIVNGYVSQMNDKSEFYSLPPGEPFAGTSDWYNLLAIHEGRHMVQMTHLRNSFFQKVLGILFGEYGIMGSIFIPGYVYEGDAVLTETLLSDSGRGRSPGFERGLRTMILNDKDFSFSKAFHGSTKDNIPNHYVLGYYLMTYLRKEYGAKEVEKIVKNSANNPFPLNFSAANFFNTGKTMPKIYDEVIADLKEKWANQDSKVTPTKTELLIPENKKTYTDLVYPEINNNGDLFYIEVGFDQSPTLMSYNNGEVKKHTTMVNDFSVNGSTIAFAKSSNDPRWTSKGYSDIYLYDSNKNKTRPLTSKQRYFNPVYSNNGKKITVTEYSLERVPSLLILDASDGKILQRVTLPKGENLTGVSWNGDDTKIAISKITKQGASIGLLDLDTEEIKYITAEDNIEKSFPIFYKNNILFVSSYSGIENINAINIDTNEEYQVISSRFGANYPEVVGDDLVYSDYTVDGFNLCKVNLNPNTWVPISKIERDHVDYFEPLQEEELSTPKISTKEYPVEEYNPNTHLIDIHSWLANPIVPLFAKSDIYNSDFFDVMELVLFSNDKLGYMDSTFYTHYSTNSSAWDIGTTGKYKAFYPEIGWDLNIYSEEIDSGISTTTIAIDTSIPLSLSGYPTMNNIRFGVYPKYYKDFRNDDESTTDLSLYLQYEYIKAGNRGRIHSVDYKLGSRVALNQNFVGDESLTASAISEVITPGLFSSHNLRIQNSITYDLNNKKSISDSEHRFPIQPSIDVKTDDSSFISFINLDYGIPIFAFDVSLFNWLYITNFNLLFGYESFYSTETDYNHIAKTSIELNYQLLRTPYKLYSDFSYYYDIDENEFDFSLNIIKIKASY